MGRCKVGSIAALRAGALTPSDPITLISHHCFALFDVALHHIKFTFYRVAFQSALRVSAPERPGPVLRMSVSDFLGARAFSRQQPNPKRERPQGLEQAGGSFVPFVG